MTDNDKEQFARVMQGLAENFGAQLSATGIAMRFETLRGFDISAIKKAAISLMASRKFTTMPTVADFVEHLGGGSVDDSAQIEAGKVWEAVRDHGGTHTVCFDDPTTQAVIVNGFGGWQRLCSELMEDHRKWFIIEFVKMYGAYARRGIKQFGPLVGRLPSVNGGIRLIGDKDKARAVLEMECEARKEIASATDVLRNLLTSG